MSGYSYVLNAAGRNRADVLERDDGVMCSLIASGVDDLSAQAWLVAGNAPAPAVPRVTGRQIVGQAKAAGIGSAVLSFLAMPTTIASMPTSVAYWNAVALDTQVPINNAKMANILTGAGVKDVPGFMSAALLLPA